MVSCGIIGLPNVGKSTVFNALVTGRKALTARHPFTTIDRNIGTVNVPDDTLFALAKNENIEKVTPGTIAFVDIAGLIRGANLGEGLGNEFLHHIREVNLILHVVRFFQDENVPHVHQKIDPADDLTIINDELILSDIAAIERRIAREKVGREEKEVLMRFSKALDQGVLARDIEVSQKEKEFLVPLNLLTFKKQIIIANIGEEDLANLPKKIDKEGVLSICAKLESELAEFPWTAQQQFLKEYGLSHSAKDEIIRAAYEALDVITFYTIAKRQEARAWTLGRGKTAVEAAGTVHTDFAKHFIKAEVINASELIRIGSWHKAKIDGKIALHGKDYVVLDQDVIEFKIGG